MNQSLKNELWGLENKFWESMMESGNADDAVGLLAEQAVNVSGWGANTFDPKGYKEMSEQSPFKMQSFKLSDEKWVFPGDNVAVVAYTSDLDFTDEKGAKQKMKAFNTTTWVNQDDSWKAAAHTESTATPTPATA